MVTLGDERQLSVLKAIERLLRGPPQSKRSVSLDMRTKAMEMSELPVILATYLLLCENKIYYHLLELINLAQKLSKECCKCIYI